MAILLLMSSSFMACDSDDSDDIFVPFTQYALDHFNSWDVNYNCQGNAIWVNSDEELNTLFQGDEYSPIDFSKYSLLLVSGTANYGVAKKTISSIQQLSTDKYIVNVELILYVTTVVESWVIPVLVDKVSDYSEVETNVTIVR